MNDYEIASIMDWPAAALADLSPGSLLDRVRAVVAAAESGERERQRAEVERLQADDLDHRAAFGEIYSALRPAYPLRSTWPAEIERLQADAARYRWLRAQHWSAGPLAVVAGPKQAVKLGHDCPSLDRLDSAIDAAMRDAPGAAIRGN